MAEPQRGAFRDENHVQLFIGVAGVADAIRYARKPRKYARYARYASNRQRGEKREMKAYHWAQRRPSTRKPTRSESAPRSFPRLARCPGEGLFEQAFEAEVRADDAFAVRAGCLLAHIEKVKRIRPNRKRSFWR